MLNLVDMKPGSNKIKTALLAYGMSGRVFHGPLLSAHEGFEIHSVFQRDRTKQATHQHPVVFDVKDILKDDNIELVIVNTSNESHFDYAKKCIKAGKHVVVEKPFAVTTKEADKLIELAEKHNVLLTVFQNRRWDSGFLTIRKILDLKLIGKIVEVEMHYDRFRNVVDTTTWKEKRDPGTGALYNLGSHLLDQVIVLFGMPKYLDGRVGVQRPGGIADDFYDIRLEYEDFQVIVKTSYLVKEPGPGYAIHGTEGSFVKFGIDPQEELLNQGTIPDHGNWAKEPKEKWGKLNSIANGSEYNGAYESEAGNYMIFYDKLFDAIRHGGSLPVDPRDSRNGIELIEAVYKSSRKKKAIRIS